MTRPRTIELYSPYPPSEFSRRLRDALNIPMDNIRLILGKPQFGGDVSANRLCLTRSSFTFFRMQNYLSATIVEFNGGSLVRGQFGINPAIKYIWLFFGSLLLIAVGIYVESIFVWIMAISTIGGLTYFVLKSFDRDLSHNRDAQEMIDFLKQITQSTETQPHGIVQVTS